MLPRILIVVCLLLASYSTIVYSQSPPPKVATTNEAAATNQLPTSKQAAATTQAPKASNANEVPPKNRAPVNLPEPTVIKGFPDDYTNCDTIYDTTSTNCTARGFASLFLVGGVYCFNNGTGICKAFSGQFEYFVDTKTNTWLGKVPESRWVNQFGYHKRIPHAYNLDGEIVYADRGIKWARKWTSGLEHKSIMFIEDVNWCQFVDYDYWPYRSVIRKAPYTIYFFNRQTCIIKDGDSKHYLFNTRFQDNSKLTVDFDINPVIFLFEDLKLPGADKIRLVKEKREYWFEQQFKVLENPVKGVKFWIKSSLQEDPEGHFTASSGGLINSRMLKKLNTTSKCFDDDYVKLHQNNVSGIHISDKRLPTPCGVERVEYLDINQLEYYQSLKKGIGGRCPIHGSTGGLGSDFYQNQDKYLGSFKKGHPNTIARTSIPVDHVSSSIYAIHGEYEGGPKIEYDITWPQIILEDHYVSEYNDTNRPKPEPNKTAPTDYIISKMNDSRIMLNMNYIDDMAYLYHCDTILVIFGPIYTEVPRDSLFKKTPLASIYELGLNELTNAFVVHPDPRYNSIFFFLRTNFVAEHHYTCAKEPGQIVTAKRQANYYRVVGPNRARLLQTISNMIIRYKVSEEFPFQALGLFKGEVEPEAPDAEQFPLHETSYLWLYILLALLLLAIILFCLYHYLMRRRKRSKRSSNKLSSALTTRSSSLRSKHLNSASQVSKRSSIGVTPTQRSGSLMGRKQSSSVASAQPSRSQRSAKIDPSILSALSKFTNKTHGKERSLSMGSRSLSHSGKVSGAGGKSRVSRASRPVPAGAASAARSLSRNGPGSRASSAATERSRSSSSSRSWSRGR